MTEDCSENRIENAQPGFFEDAGARLLSNGIIALKNSKPAGWANFKLGLKAVAKTATTLDEVTDDDMVTGEEVLKALQSARDYGAFRTLEDMLFGLLKHVRS